MSLEKEKLMTNRRTPKAGILVPVKPSGSYCAGLLRAFGGRDFAYKSIKDATRQSRLKRIDSREIERVISSGHVSRAGRV